MLSEKIAHQYQKIALNMNLVKFLSLNINILNLKFGCEKVANNFFPEC